MATSVRILRRDTSPFAILALQGTQKAAELISTNELSVNTQKQKGTGTFEKTEDKPKLKIISVQKLNKKEEKGEEKNNEAVMKAGLLVRQKRIPIFKRAILAKRFVTSILDGILLSVVTKSGFVPVSGKLVEKQRLLNVQEKLFTSQLAENVNKMVEVGPKEVVKKKLSASASVFVPGQVVCPVFVDQMDLKQKEIKELKAKASLMKSIYMESNATFMEPVKIELEILDSVKQRGKSSVFGMAASSKAEREIIKVLEQEADEARKKSILAAAQKKEALKKAKIDEKITLDEKVNEKNEKKVVKKDKRAQSDRTAEEKILEIMELDIARGAIRQQLMSQNSAYRLLIQKQKQENLRNWGWSNLGGAYLGNMQSPLLMENATKLLSELARIQTKHYERDPKCKRRYVCGLKQVMKHIRGKSLKYLIVARKVDEMVEYFHTVLAEALVNHVPIIFALNRRQLSKAVGKPSKVSAVGILDDSGAHDIYDKLSDHARVSRETYQMFSNDPFRNLCN